MTEQTCVQCIGHTHPTQAAKELCLRFMTSRPNAADRDESRYLACVPRCQRRLGRLSPGFSPWKDKTVDCQGINSTYIGDDDDDDDEGNSRDKQLSTKRNKTKKNKKWARACRFFEGQNSNGNDNDNNDKCVVTLDPRSSDRSNNRSPTRRSQNKTDGTASMKRCRISVDWGLFPSGPFQHRGANSNESFQQCGDDEVDPDEFSTLIEGLKEMAPNRTRKSLTRVFLPRRLVKDTVEQDDETIKMSRKRKKNKKRNNNDNDKEKNDRKQGPINLFAV